MIHEVVPLLFSLGMLASAQDPKTPPAAGEVRAAFEKCEAAQRAFTTAFNASRPASGKTPLPPGLQKLRDAQEAEVAAFLARFGDSKRVPPAACQSRAVGHLYGGRHHDR